MVDEPESPPYVRLLQTVATMRRELAEIEYQAVVMARQAGATWQEIGDEFDMSRQAAREYFSRPKGRHQGPSIRSDGD